MNDSKDKVAVLFSQLKEKYLAAKPVETLPFYSLTFFTNGIEGWVSLDKVWLHLAYFADDLCVEKFYLNGVLFDE